MHISQVLRSATKDQPSWSFEFYPPKTEQGLVNLYERIGRMTSLGPSFIGAGGTTSDLTTSFVRTAHEAFGLETCMHLTCTNIVPETVHAALQEARNAGCLNILALRGDPPRGEERWAAVEGGFEHASDLIRYIRQEHGDTFCIGVAGFPEGHPDAEHGREAELRHLRAKVDAGADFIVTQMFYDYDTFERWVRDLRNAGITIPILPGIMPIQGWQSFQRTTSFSKTIVPQEFWDRLEAVKDDDQRVREVGTELVAGLCQRILQSDLGIHSLHFYTMNLERGTAMLLEKLEMVAQVDVVNPLPWRPSLTAKRRAESTRPIHWSNRPGSYLARTETWDEFPNGRWGDSRSPAYGELDGYGVNLKLTALETWGEPQTVDDLGKLFARFCRGDLANLPWSDQAPSKETFTISDPLADLNELGFLTINSQPPVDGADSKDPTFGWGPKHGYVYQKAYLEFFCSPEQLEKLKQRWSSDPHVTWHAVTRSGELETNATSSNPTVVTWGVFPGREVLQTTIVEQVSFLAWRDEAFELGKRWGELYAPESATRKLLTDVFSSFYLVNVVRHDYRNSDANAIFAPFLSGTASPRPRVQQREAGLNGVNGRADSPCSVNVKGVTDATLHQRRRSSTLASAPAVSAH